MTNFHVIRMARLKDRQVIDLVDKFRRKTTLQSASITLGPGVKVDITVESSDDGQTDKLYGDRHAIHRATIVTQGGIIITFFRGITTNVNNPHDNRQASSYFDEVFLSINERLQVPEMWNQVIECIDIIEEAVPEVFPIQGVDKVHSAVDVLQAQMGSLADQYRDMLGGLAKERAALRKDFDDRRQSMDQEREAEKRRLEREAEKRIEQFEVYRDRETQSLQKQASDLEKREEDLDNRQHMHARRELRQQITDNLKKRIGKPVVTKRASSMRWAVFGVTMILGLGLGYYGLESFDIEEIKDTYQLSKNTTALSWMPLSLILRPSILLFLSAGFVAYAINWLRVVYLDDVRTERRYESYGNDIDRASFVIETIMEVGEKEKTTVPDAWVEGLCRNLFAESGDLNYGKVPSNAAAMLFESIAGAKFGPEGSEVTMGRRDARRFAKKLGDRK